MQLLIWWPNYLPNCYFITQIHIKKTKWKRNSTCRFIILREKEGGGGWATQQNTLYDAIVKLMALLYWKLKIINTVSRSSASSRWTFPWDQRHPQVHTAEREPWLSIIFLYKMTINSWMILVAVQFPYLFLLRFCFWSKNIVFHSALYWK